MRATFLSFAPPNVGDEEIEAAGAAIRSGWITTGPKTGEFEAAFQEYLGSPATLALNSCTAGLHTALITAGVGPDDEVITTTTTFAATVHVIEHVGATPVLVDVEPDTLNLSPEAVAKARTERTRAIIAVHFAGHPAECSSLNELAEASSSVLIEDAAHALPATYRDRPIGAGPNPVSFSFYATKNLTTGEGGMLTGDPGFIDEARIVSLHGMTRDAWDRYSESGRWFYEIVRPGFKYNMSDIQAAIGLVQLRKLDSFQARRRQIVDMYNSAFSSYEVFQTPVERAHVRSAWHLYVLRLQLDALSIDRDSFIARLHDLNIGTSVHFIPIHVHPYFRDRYGYTPSDFPIAYSNYLRSVSLPLHPGLSDRDVSDVIEAVVHVAESNRR